MILAIGKHRVDFHAFKCSEWMQRKPEWFKFTRCEPRTHERMEHGWRIHNWYLTVWRIQFCFEYARVYHLRVDGVPT